MMSAKDCSRQQSGQAIYPISLHSNHVQAGTYSCGTTLLRRLAGELPATLLLTLPVLNAAACCAWGVAGSQPLLVIPSASIKRCMMSSVMTSRCSRAACRERSFAETQWMYDLVEGLCSTIATPIFFDEAGAKLITSRHRFGPYIARAFADCLSRRLTFLGSIYIPNTLDFIPSKESPSSLSSM